METKLVLPDPSSLSGIFTELIIEPPFFSVSTFQIKVVGIGIKIVKVVRLLKLLNFLLK